MIKIGICFVFLSANFAFSFPYETRNIDGKLSIPKYIFNGKSIWADDEKEQIKNNSGKLIATGTGTFTTGSNFTITESSFTIVVLTADEQTEFARKEDDLKNKKLGVRDWITAKSNYDKIDKESIDPFDILKRIEILERMFGLR